MDFNPSTEEQQTPFQEDSDIYIQAKSQEFLQSLSQLYRETVVNKKQALTFFKYSRFLANTVSNLSKKELSPNDQRLEITESALKNDGFVTCLLSLGYKLDICSEDCVVLILQTQPSKKVLDRILETMKHEYLLNKELLAAVQHERRELDKKNEVIIEEEDVRVVYPEMNRSQQKADNSDHDAQVDDYRKRMQERFQRETYVPPPANANINANANVNVNQNQNQNVGAGSFVERPKPAEEKKEETKTMGPVGSGTGRNFGKMGREELRANLDSQLNDYRSQMRNRGGRNMSDKREQAEERKEEPITEDQVKIGKYALQLTNEFRSQYGLRPLTWNQELCDIAMTHSRNMAIGKVDVSYIDFDDRRDQIRFKTSTVAENVGVTEDHPPAQAIVNGWINSVVHRKNLMSETNVCGIACYRAEDGLWYFTQMFAQKQGTSKNIVIITIVILLIAYQYWRYTEEEPRHYWDL